MAIDLEAVRVLLPVRPEDDRPDSQDRPLGAVLERVPLEVLSEALPALFDQEEPADR